MTKKNTPQDFWDKVNKNGPIMPNMSTPCWEWKNYKNKQGYGIARHQGKLWTAHRLAFVLHYGSLPLGMFACHHCDNPSCVNPEHLFAGTVSNNMQDMKNKNRDNYCIGSKNGRAKLTDNQIIEIRNLRNKGKTYTELAKIFNVGKTTIAHIIKRDNWKHLTIP